MKTLFKKFKILFIFLFILSFQNCTDKEFTSNSKQDFISGYFTATVTGQSVFSWSASSISAGYSSYIWVRGNFAQSNEYMEFHLPLSATSSQTYDNFDGVSFVLYKNNTSYNNSNCTAYASITISEKTSSYIQGTFIATVADSFCNGYTISSGSFQVYF